MQFLPCIRPFFHLSLRWTAYFTVPHWPLSGLPYSLYQAKDLIIFVVQFLATNFLHEVVNHILISLFYSTVHIIWNTALEVLPVLPVTHFLVADGHFLLKCLHSFSTVGQIARSAATLIQIGACRSPEQFCQWPLQDHLDHCSQGLRWVHRAVSQACSHPQRKCQAGQKTGTSQ